MIPDDDNDASDIDDIGLSVASYRRELEQLKEKGRKARELYSNEWTMLQNDHCVARSRLSQLLARLPKTFFSIFMTRVKESHSCLPPLYFLKNEVQLCVAMHHTFLVYPEQMKIIEAQNARMKAYLEEEREQLKADTQQSEQIQLVNVSRVAESLHALHENLHRIIKQQELQLSDLRRLLEELRIKQNLNDAVAKASFSSSSTQELSDDDFSDDDSSANEESSISAKRHQFSEILHSFAGNRLSRRNIRIIVARR